jgi:hypothetical protein
MYFSRGYDLIEKMDEKYELAKWPLFFEYLYIYLNFLSQLIGKKSGQMARY